MLLLRFQDSPFDSGRTSGGRQDGCRKARSSRDLLYERAVPRNTSTLIRGASPGLFNVLHLD